VAAGAERESAGASCAEPSAGDGDVMRMTEAEYVELCLGKAETNLGDAARWLALMDDLTEEEQQHLSIMLLDLGESLKEMHEALLEPQGWVTT
jgi:hypothetical protein